MTAHAGQPQQSNANSLARDHGRDQRSRGAVPAGGERYRSWITEVRLWGVAVVARRFGLGADARNVAACPSCRTEQRGSLDRRPPIGITADGLGWRCHRCKAGGDAVTLARLCLSADPAAPVDWRLVRYACVERGLCSPPGGRISSVAAPSPARSPPPRRPPSDEVARVWSSSLPVTEDAEVAAWLRSRGLHVNLVAERDLVRAIPDALALPDWMTFGGVHWHQCPERYRILLEVVGPGGGAESLHARALRPSARGRKALWPAGFAAGGLLLADPPARRLLAGDDEASVRVRRFGLIIAEGVPDFLTWATHWHSRDLSAPAVFGLASGSWSDGFARRVPDHTRVWVRTHQDTTGRKYADDVVRSLAHRCDVRRLVPEVCAGD